MAKPHIPLPKQVEKTHKAVTDYDRRREQQVKLDEAKAMHSDVWDKIDAAFDARRANPPSWGSLQTAQTTPALNQGNHDQDNLEIFLASDQPEVCRYCGKIRTDFTDVGNRQLHTCPECSKSYWVEEDTDTEEE